MNISYESLQRENAKLTRKLAMQQARLKQIYTLLRNEVSVALYYGMANINNANPESGSKLDETSKHLERVGDLVDEVLKHPTNEEELTKLLAEAKSKAVPEFQTFNEWMHKEIPGGTIIGDAGWWASRIYRKFIAQSPETDIDQEQRFK